MTETPVDVPEYKNLQLLDYGTEQDLVDAALAYTQQALPEWRQRTGNTEVVLIQALALMLGPEVMAIQMLPAQILEQLMAMYGISRDPGTPVRGIVRIIVTASAPTQTIPAGTRLRLTLPDTEETVDFFTDQAATVITTDTLHVDVSVTSEFLGIVGNQTVAGTRLDVVDPLTFIESVEVLETLAGGIGAEGDGPYYARASATLARLTSTLVLPEHFQYAALTRAGVGRAKVFDLYDPGAPNIVSAGHVTIAAANSTGAPLGIDDSTNLEAWLASQALASLTIHVIEPTYTPVDVVATVRATPGTDELQLASAVTDTLTRWLNPARWDWSATITQNQLVAVIASTPGVREVVSVTPGAALAGKAPLPTVGSVSVTVAP